MKYRQIILIITLLASIHIYAQDDAIVVGDTPTQETTRHVKTYSKLDASLSGLGLSLETPLSSRVLLDFAVGAGAGYKVNEDFRYRMYFDNPSIYGSIHAKYYYSHEKRIRQGRPLSFNAGNFFGVKTKYTTPNLSGAAKTWHTMLVAFHWGMQRKMGRHFMYQLTVGVGGAIDLEDKTTTHMTLYPDFNFRVSYVLPFGK